MDIFFTDPADIPLPPDEVRIRDFKVEPYPDSRRLYVNLVITPFQKKPSGEIVIFDFLGTPVTSASIIETIDPRMQITMHLRSPETAGEYTATVVLFYNPEVEEQEDGDEILSLPERKVVDQAETTFSIGS
jgi:hypothetical protein